MSNYEIIKRELLEIGVSEYAIKRHLSKNLVERHSKIKTYDDIWRIISLISVFPWDTSGVRDIMMANKYKFSMNYNKIRYISSIKYNKDLK